MLQFLLGPLHTIIGQERQSSSRLLSALMLGRILAILGIVGSVLFPVEPEFGLPHHIALKILSAAIGLNLVAYFVARTRAYEWSCLIILIEGFLGISYSAINSGSTLVIATSTNWLGLSTLICSLVLSVPLAVSAMAATLGVYFFLMFKISPDGVPFIQGNLIYYIASSTLIIVGAVMRANAFERLNSKRSQLVGAAKLTALGEMAGNIAHEVNNPVQIIDLLSSEIEDLVKTDPLNREEISEIAGKLRKTCERMSKIVKGLRSFSRDSRLDPLQPVRVAEMIESTLSFSRERFKIGGVDLCVDPVDPELVFEGRSVEISQVLINLLNNAFDAAVDAQNRWVKVSASLSRNEIEISVTDSGAGVSPADEKKMFQPFFTTKEAGKGTGLGLSISKDILDRYGGRIYLQRNAPHTCFVLSLPQKQVPSLNRAA